MSKIPFMNGQVLTVNQNNDIAEAVLVNGNKIQFVGSSEDGRSSQLKTQKHSS